MAKVRFFSSLQFQITVAISIMVITAVVSMGLMVTYLSKTIIEEQKKELGLSTAAEIKRTASRPTVAEAAVGHKGLPQLASRVIRSYFDSRFHHSLTFFNSEGDIVFSTLPVKNWTYAKVFLPVVNMPNMQVQFSQMIDPKNGEEVLVYTFPWVVSSVTEGRIQFVIPLINDEQRFLFSGRFIFVFAAIYTLLIILLGSLLLKQMIIKPVADLNRAVLNLKDGQREFLSPRGDKNELGQLAQSFSEMARHLSFNEQKQSEQIEELLRVNEELELTRRGLIRSEKLASVGKLAAGVAHEVGNPLSAILGYVELLKQGGLDDEMEKDFLVRIEKDITRVSKIIRGLLDYSRLRREKVEKLDFNSIIEESIELIKHQKQFKRISFDFTSHYKPAYIEVDFNQLQQVFVNLFINASHSMKEEGTITIFLEKVQYDPSLTYRENVNHFKEGQNLIAVSVIDHGEGMDEETAKRIFDPFFTTKEPGFGTGLGLSVSDKIIDSFGGILEVITQKGEGATFTILVPEAVEITFNNDSEELEENIPDIIG